MSFTILVCLFIIAFFVKNMLICKLICENSGTIFKLVDLMRYLIMGNSQYNNMKIVEIFRENVGG